MNQLQSFQKICSSKNSKMHCITTILEKIDGMSPLKHVKSKLEHLINNQGFKTRVKYEVRKVADMSEK